MLQTAIANWWIAFVLAAVGAFITWFFKRYIKLEKENQEKHMKEVTKEVVKENQKSFQEFVMNQGELFKELKENQKEILEQQEETKEYVDTVLKAGRIESKADDKILSDQIHKLENNQDGMREGILAILKPQFIKQCEILIDSDEEITQDMFDELCEAHDSYNKLGGNHRGDEKFRMVKGKFEKQHGIK